MPYFGLYVQLRRGSVAGYTTDESWAYRPKEGVEAFESITFFIRLIHAINYEHLLKNNTLYMDNKNERFPLVDETGNVLGSICLLYTSPSPRD